MVLEMYQISFDLLDGAELVDCDVVLNRGHRGQDLDRRFVPGIDLGFRGSRPQYVTAQSAQLISCGRIGPGGGPGPPVHPRNAGVRFHASVTNDHTIVCRCRVQTNFKRTARIELPQGLSKRLSCDVGKKNIT